MATKRKASKQKDYTVQASIGIVIVVFLAIGISTSVNQQRASKKAIVATKPSPPPIPEPVFTTTKSSPGSPESILIFLCVIAVMVRSIQKSLSDQQKASQGQSVKPVEELSSREYLYQLCQGDRELADRLARGVGYETAVAQLLRDRGGR